MAVRDTFWFGRKVLVTGHTGFKGAWLALWLARMGARVTGIALPAENPSGIFGMLEPWNEMDSRFCDVRDRSQVEAILLEAKPEVIFHLAAQSLVGRGWQEPTATYEINISGTSNLLEAAALVKPLRACVVVTTDKVYGPRADKRGAREGDPLDARDPYSISKVAAEMVVAAWRLSHPRIPIATARSGNVMGGGDVASGRLMPDLLKAVLEGSEVVLRHPAAVRPWQFVLEPLAGYLALAERLIKDPEGCPPTFNFGPDPSCSQSVSEVVDLAHIFLGRGGWVPGKNSEWPETECLVLDASLAKRELNWALRLDTAKAVEWTVNWWRSASRDRDLRRLSIAQIDDYETLLPN